MAIQTERWLVKAPVNFRKISYRRITVDALNVFLDFVKKNLVGWVYRGQSQSEWLLDSSFDRKLNTRINQSDVLDTAEMTRQILELERKVLDTFKEMWIRYGRKKSKDPRSQLEWAMLAQHYGCPTRLIDFTDKINVALYFATASDCDKDFSVWALRDNSFSFGNIEKDFELCSNIFDGNKTDSVLDKWVILRPSQIPGLNIGMVIERLKRQHGLFVMPLHLNISTEYILSDATLPFEWRVGRNVKPSTILSNFQMEKDVSIVEFVFDKSIKHNVKEYLKKNGTTPLTLFPDISGIEKEIDFQWPFGFETSKWSFWPF